MKRKIVMQVVASTQDRRSAGLEYLARMVSCLQNRPASSRPPECLTVSPGHEDVDGGGTYCNSLAQASEYRLTVKDMADVYGQRDGWLHAQMCARVCLDAVNEQDRGLRKCACA